MTREDKTKEELFEEIALLQKRVAELLAVNTELKKDDPILRLSEQQQVMLDASPAMIFYKDKENRFIRVNEALARANGKSRKEMEGKTCWELYSREMADHYWQDDQEVIASGKSKLNIIESMETPQGSLLVQTDKILCRDSKGVIIGIIGFTLDITERKRAETYREMGGEVLQILNEPRDLQDSIQRIITLLKKRTGFDAVGIRLQSGEDFPYFAQQGFSREFLQTENTLVEHAVDGGVCRDQDGKVRLECTCGLVLSGKADSASSLFTPGGSFWTSDSFPLLDLPSDQDPRFHPRNQCIHQGYASVALVPIRDKNGIVGLIHMNDRRKGRFNLETVELLEGVASHIGEALMRKQTEEALKQKVEELERFNKIAVGRELKMVELKEKIKMLEEGKK